MNLAGGVLAAILLVSAIPADAEVTGTNQAGFAVSGTLTVAAPPARVWDALVKPSRWWNPEHSWSGNAANLSLDPRAGGCFCERLPSRGSVEHMRVIYADPGKQLRMTGSLGPMQGEALAATLTVTLATANDGTKLSWQYKAGGYSALPFAQLAPAVDGVLAEQFHRLAVVFTPTTFPVR